jgi:dipeptidase D
MKPADYPQQPAHLWDHFYAITQIPRPSGQEAALRDHIASLGSSRGCSSAMDHAGNLVVRLPGSGKLTDAPTVVIQNHLDMVTVKTDDKPHDFGRDPLTLKVEGDWLLADRTTLGADNGVGCAAAMALITDDSVVHPPLELLFTVEEETGLYGAADLDPGLVSGRRMLNLDTEDWGEVFVGCAGGRGWQFSRPLPRDNSAGSPAWRLVLRGLAGGHSGLQIHLQLGNAVKLLGQWLYAARDLGPRLVSFEGGVAHNVIPREASLVFSCEASLAQLQAVTAQMRERWLSYLPAADAGLELEIVPAGESVPLTCAAQAQVEQMLLMFPHGAVNYSLAQPGELVDLSVNLAIVRVDQSGLFIETTLRYFNLNEAEGLSQQLLAIAEWLGCEVTATIDYPGWQPDFDSPLLQLTCTTYAELFSDRPAVKALHAGLECGILKSKQPAVDIVSFGPTIRGAHSPGERLQISTVAPFWQLLTRLLERLD